MRKNLLQFSLLLITTFLFSTMSWGQTTVTYDFSASGAVTGLNENVPGIPIDSNIGFGSFKNLGTSNPGIFSNQLRLYQNATKGGSIKIYANNGVTITNVVVNASGTTGPAGYTIDGGTQTNLTASTTYTINSINATSEVEFFQRDGSDRIYVNSFVVTYTAGASPILVSNVTTISNLDYQIGNGPSTEQSISLSGTNLDGSDVTVSLPASSDFELAETASGSYSNLITLASFDGTATDIFVRLKSGLSINSYSDDITVSGGGATDITVAISGSVTLQNVETFQNSGATGTYANGSFVGVNGITWTYLASRDANNDANGSGIDLPALMLRRASDNSKVTSSTISGGISDFSVKLYKGFTAGGNRQVELFINGVSQGTSTPFNNFNEQTFTVEDIDISGDFTLEIRNITGDQVIVDDISWNSFTPDFTYQNNTWTPSNPVGASTATDNILIADGSVDITGTLQALHLEIASGATLNVTPSGVLNLAGNIINNGDLVFQSDATGSGQLASFSGTITGNLTAERYIPAKRAFRLTSSPVGGVTIANSWQQNTHITGTGGATNGFDATGTDNPSMFTFDNAIPNQSSGAAWEAVANTNATNLNAGVPYRLFVRGDRTINLTDNAAPATVTTLSATGTLHTGSYSPTLATVANHYSFIGNPYQAVVDFNAVTTTNLTGFLYIWDASIGGANGRGGYTVVAASDGSQASISPYSSDANQYIMPGQAFFVQNTGDGGGSVTFEETDKATTQSQVSIFSEYTNFYINSRLYKTSALQNGEMESDAIGLRFNEQYTTIGSEEDASKLANPGENYAIVNNGFKSIDKQNIPTDGHQVDLLIVNYEENAYSLSFTLGNQPEALKVYLNDSYLATQTELTESTTYNFTVDANVPESIDQNRFHLSFETVALGQQDFTEVQVRLYPNPVVDELQIELPASVLVNSVKIFNLLGQEVIASTRPQVDVRLLSSGFYLVQVDTSAGTVTKKIIKK